MNFGQWTNWMQGEFLMIGCERLADLSIISGDILFGFGGMSGTVILSKYPLLSISVLSCAYVGQ